MRDGPSSEVLAGAAGWRPSAASWLDGRLLADDVPILSGRLSASADLAVPERVVFTVPEVDIDGFSWVPDGADHPLAKYGQRIDLSVVVTSSLTGAETITRLGWFRVHDWAHDDASGAVRVTCLGILSQPAEDRFAVPESPRSGGTLGSEFRRLMSPGIPVSIDASLTDRACPASFQWPQDRLAALHEIAEAWPARVRADQWGEVAVLPALAEVPSPVLWFTDGQGGTLVSAPRSDTRAAGYNVFVGTSSATDSTAVDPLRAVAQIAAGPMRAVDDGTGYGRVVTYWSSPLATTQAMLQASVDTMRDNAARRSQVRTVSHVPDPRVELDDAVSVTRDGRTEWGYVVAYELPLTIGDGLARTDVGVTG